MKLQTLYSRRGDEGIQEWTIEIEKNKYRTISGTQDGEKVVAKWTECQGKNIGRSNETTPEKQAELEAKMQSYTDADEKFYLTANSLSLLS